MIERFIEWLALVLGFEIIGTPHENVKEIRKVESSSTPPTPESKPITNPNRPIDDATVVYVRSAGPSAEVTECRVRYDEWWCPKAWDLDRLSYELAADGRVLTWNVPSHGSGEAEGYSWVLKEGPEIHFPSEEDLKEFFPPDHPESIRKALEQC